MSFVERRKPRKFRPRPYYGEAEDSLTFYFDNAESYGRRIDGLLTLFLSLKGDKLVGFQVKGVRKNLRRPGDFGLRSSTAKSVAGFSSTCWHFWPKNLSKRRLISTWVRRRATSTWS